MRAVSTVECCIERGFGTSRILCLDLECRILRSLPSGIRTVRDESTPWDDVKGTEAIFWKQMILRRPGFERPHFFHIHLQGHAREQNLPLEHTRARMGSIYVRGRV